MFKKIKQNSLRKHLTKSLEQRDISKRNSAITSLGFLVEEEFYSDFEALQQLGLDLGLQPKNIKIFTFIETKNKTPTLRQNQISHKEFSWLGEIRNQDALDFLEFQFDALMGIYRSPNAYLKSMVARSQAHFKIGFSGSDDRLYDLIMDIDPRDKRLLESELKKYLKILKKI